MKNLTLNFCYLPNIFLLKILIWAVCKGFIPHISCPRMPILCRRNANVKDNKCVAKINKICISNMKFKIL